MRYLKIFIVILLLRMLILPQTSHLSYYSQKIMLENTIKERINEALNKILEDIKFVVDVNIELDYQTSQPKAQAEKEAGEKATTESKYLPLPGFETPSDLSLKEQQEESASGEQPKTSISPSGIPYIKKQVINIILEEGVSSELLQSVREVASVAAHLDKARGDELIIKTAPFTKQKSDAEALILKNIAEKIDEIDKRQKDIEEKSKLEEEKRNERQRIIQDSLRIAQLEEELQKLKEILATQQLTEAQRRITEDQATEREMQIDTLKAQLEESNRKLQELEKSLSGTPSGKFLSLGDNYLIYLIIGILGLLLIIALILILTMKRSVKPVAAVTERIEEPVVSKPQVKQQVVAQPRSEVDKTVDETKLREEEERLKRLEEIEQQKEELKSLKQSVISMSVGQPDAATRILSEWLKSSKSTETEGE